MQDNPRKSRTEIPQRIRSKDLALKILMLYSEATGKKWKRIRDEMFSVLGLGDSESSPLIVRQDLENWATGKNVIGDSKFNIILDFLLHPNMRSKLAYYGVDGLLDADESTWNIGNRIHQFYGPAANFVIGDDGSIQRLKFGAIQPFPSRTFISWGTLVCTISFFGNHADGFLRAHLVHWLDGKVPDERDADMNASHYGGFLLSTMRGNKMLLRGRANQVIMFDELKDMNNLDNVNEVCFAYSGSGGHVFDSLKHQKFYLFENKFVEDTINSVDIRWRAQA